MIVSVGQLHSSAHLLELASINPLNSREILMEFGTVVVCPVESVLNLCLRCGWLEADAEGVLRLSTRGSTIRAKTDFQERLREQLIDVILLQPTWCKLIMHGRRELYRSAPPDIRQCFEEAGMAGRLDEGKITWWDRLAGLVRGFRNLRALETGRKGERLSIQFEIVRTKKEPFWQAIETNFSGYDVLSVVSDSDITPLQIEVKASEGVLSSAKIHISANEWKAARVARAYIFHLWLIGKQNRLAILSIDDIEPHIPSNRGDGDWESVEIGYKAFASEFFEVK